MAWGFSKKIENHAAMGWIPLFSRVNRQNLHPHRQIMPLHLAGAHILVVRITADNFHANADARR
jgi:hypothetical protein